jgi:hypothetical protein
MGSGTERDPLIVPGYSVTAAAVGTKTLVRRRFFLQRPNKLLLLYLLFEMWVSKVEKQWRFGNLRFDNPSTLSTKTT